MLRSVRAVIPENALLRFGRKQDGGVGAGGWLRLRFEIRKEEQLVLQVGDEWKQRTADAAVGIVLAAVRNHLTAQIIEERIRVQVFVGKLLADGEVILIRTALGGEADRHGPLGGRFCAETGSGNGNLVDGVDARGSER